MDREYYGLKALVIGAAVFAAVLGGGVECSRLTLPQNPNYQAAYIARSGLRDASVNVSRSVGHALAQVLANVMAPHRD